jgi:hypothetical protein
METEWFGMFRQLREGWAHSPLWLAANLPYGPLSPAGGHHASRPISRAMAQDGC